MFGKPWRVVPPPNGNPGNPWTVADETGETIAIITRSTYGTGELVARQIVRDHHDAEMRRAPSPCCHCDGSGRERDGSTCTDCDGTCCSQHYKGVDPSCGTCRIA